MCGVFFNKQKKNLIYSVGLRYSFIFCVWFFPLPNSPINERAWISKHWCNESSYIELVKVSTINILFLFSFASLASTVNIRRGFLNRYCSRRYRFDVSYGKNTLWQEEEKGNTSITKKRKNEKKKQPSK